MRWLVGVQRLTRVERGGRAPWKVRVGVRGMLRYSAVREVDHPTATQLACAPAGRAEAANLVVAVDLRIAVRLWAMRYVAGRVRLGDALCRWIGGACRPSRQLTLRRRTLHGSG